MGKFMNWLKTKEESRVLVEVNMVIWLFLLLINIYFLIFRFKNNDWWASIVNIIWLLASVIMIYSSWKRLRRRENATHSGEI